MADQSDDTIVVQDAQPLSRHRKRMFNTFKSPMKQRQIRTRSTSATATALSTPPTTPLPQKKKVRFSDPGPSLDVGVDDDMGAEEHVEDGDTGLTPFMSRTTMTSPSRGNRKTSRKIKTRRRHSAPVQKVSNLDKQPIDAMMQFAPLRQVLDGRIKRRIARSGLSEELNILVKEKRRTSIRQREEMSRLRREVAEKDWEVEEMREQLEVRSQIEGESGTRGAGGAMLTRKVSELEKEVELLRDRLREKSSEYEDGEIPDWTIAARDPFDQESDDENDHISTTFDDEGLGSINIDEMDSTPTRLRTVTNHVNTSFNTSLLSPPATLPNTPCKPLELVSEGVQATLTIRDPENEQLKLQLGELRVEISELTAALALDEDMRNRLLAKISEYLPITVASSTPINPQTLLDLALDNVLTSLALSKNASDEVRTRFTDLSSQIQALGFPCNSSDPSSVLSNIASEFRAARLELEDVLPGETSEGFAPDKLLSLLLSRIKMLVQQVRDRDGEIDAYHEQETSLREQLSTRVDALDEIKSRLGSTNQAIDSLRNELIDKELSQASLTKALNGYRKEVSKLEEIISKLDQQRTILAEALETKDQELLSEKLHHDTTLADLEGKSLILLELNSRLSAALESSNRLSAEIGKLQSKDDESTQLLQEKSQAVQAQEATIVSLGARLEEMTDSLRNAQVEVEKLSVRERELQMRLETEKRNSSNAVRDMQNSIMQAWKTGEGFLAGDEGVEQRRGVSRPREVMDADEAIETSAQAQNPTAAGEQVVAESAVNNQGSLLSGDLARRRKRRKYDSGLGFLEEEDELTICSGVGVDAVH